MQRNRYRAWGRVFVVERGQLGQYMAVGRARTATIMRLDRIGPRPTDDMMQAALDRWAERMGLAPVGAEEEARS